MSQHLITLPRGTCRACFHPERAAIDAALAKGASILSLYNKYAIDRPTLTAHRDNCIPEAFRKSLALQREAEGLVGGVTTHIERIEGDIEQLRGFVTGAIAGDPAARERYEQLPMAWRDPKALAALLGALKGFLELKGKLTGEITTAPSVAIVMQHPGTAAFVEATLGALEAVLVKRFGADVAGDVMADVAAQVEQEQRAIVGGKK